MTPRQADLAYVLEGVPGVLEVHALDTTGAPAGDLELAVKVAHVTSCSSPMPARLQRRAPKVVPRR